MSRPRETFDTVWTVMFTTAAGALAWFCVAVVDLAAQVLR